ncbi:MAG: cell surface protein [Bacteroidales bacterium]|nr:cell surface protein [Bacteroidales bacterium]
MCARVISLLICALSIVSCEQPEIPMVGLGIDDTYTIERMRTLILHPEYEGEHYAWRLVSSPLASSPDSLIASTRDLIFCAADTGIYYLRFDLYSSKLQQSDLQPQGRSTGAADLQGLCPTLSHHFVVKVFEEEVTYSPYISKVLEYNPAPGQFINTIPEYEEGDNYQTMLRKAEDAIAGTNRSLISLGGWGGYVTFAFDHSVVNAPNLPDFTVEGNAFYASAGNRNGSSEPGIVMVSIDINQNGLPDDPFYELAGSEHTHSATIHQYSLTYHRTPATHTPQPDIKNSLTDTTYILWHNNQGEQGYVHKNTFHTQDYFPLWLTDSTLTFSGTRLPNNAVDKNGKGNMWVLQPYDFGYADNHPNDSISRCSFDIDWAVTADGKPANLPCADFVRVYTGVQQQCGWIGEISTEVSHARDLNIEEY